MNRQEMKAWCHFVANGETDDLAALIEEAVKDRAIVRRLHSSFLYSNCS